MKFIHLSDTHIRVNYKTNQFLRPMFNEVNNPLIQLKGILKNIKKENLDFAIITGDLVHEGELEDYKLFRKTWNEILPEVPYYFCRGNHDRREVFFEGMQVRGNSVGEYITCNNFQGLRIISLDSAQDDNHEGKISQEQFQQLSIWLEEPAKHGTILLIHHPLVWEEPGIATDVPKGFSKVIKESDVLGIFVGHIHQGTTAFFAGKPQYMSEAISFGVDEYPSESIFIDRTGYNICSLTNKELFVYHHYETPKVDIIGSIQKPFEGNF